MPRCLLSVLIAAALLGAATAHSAQGQSEGQILRPGQESSSTIVQTDRVARLTLALPVEREPAFDAWTNANQLVEWFAHWAEMTVAPDGGYRIGWEGVPGVWQGRYIEIDRPERLVFTWLPPAEVFPAGAYETTVTLTFEEAENGTTMILEQTGFLGVAELEAQLQAWRGYLFALRAFLLQPTPEQ